jgi:hypothetical protein
MSTNGMQRLLCTAAVTVTALSLAPAAHADSQDDQFLSAVAALGINGAPDQLIAAAHAVCDMWGSGQPAYLGVLGQAVAAGVPYGQTHQFYVAAGRAYCPDRLHAIGLS